MGATLLFHLGKSSKCSSNASETGSAFDRLTEVFIPHSMKSLYAFRYTLSVLAASLRFLVTDIGGSVINTIPAGRFICDGAGKCMSSCGVAAGGGV